MRLWGWLILSVLLCTQAMAAAVYTATLHGQYKGPAPVVSLSSAQQKWLQQKGQLTMGITEPGYPPFDIINFENDYIGITADYARRRWRRWRAMNSTFSAPRMASIR